MGRGRSAHDPGGSIAPDFTIDDDPYPPGDDIVAAGGTLDPATVYEAYRHGIFPFYEGDQPLLWWSPDPRAILPLGGLHVSRRLHRTLRQGRFSITRNRCFGRVMRLCGSLRGGDGWIHADMIRCFEALHEQGRAHSLEVWRDGELVAGIYGVAVGGAFAAESMFHTHRDMSKVALVRLDEHLRARGFTLLDVQFETSHLRQFGVQTIPRAEYLRRLNEARDADVSYGPADERG